MSFNASLIIDDKTYSVLSFNYSSFRNVDVFGRPTSVLFGLKFELEIEHSPDCVLLHQWAYKNHEVKGGSILFMKRDNAYQRDIEFKFKDAYISSIRFAFNNTGENPLVEKITIVSNEVEIESEGKTASYKGDIEVGPS